MTLRRNLLLAVLAAASLLLISGSAAPIDQAPEPPGSIAFVGKNAVVTANGLFHSWRITHSSVDFARLASSSVEIEIDVASLDTKIQRRDDHLRSADFFEVERWPTATARIHDVTADGENEHGHARYKALFELRIRDVTRTVAGSFAVTNDSPPTVEGSLTIDRNDWGIGKPKKRFNPISIANDVELVFRAALEQEE